MIKTVLNNLQTNQVCHAYLYAYNGPFQILSNFECKPKSINDKIFWQTRKCSILSYDQSILYVKTSKQSRHVYCMGQYIYSDDKPHNCPEWVSTHSVNLSLRIDHYTFPHFNLQYNKSTVIDPKHYD